MEGQLYIRVHAPEKFTENPTGRLQIGKLRLLNVGFDDVVNALKMMSIDAGDFTVKRDNSYPRGLVVNIYTTLPAMTEGQLGTFYTDLNVGLSAIRTSRITRRTKQASSAPTSTG